MRFRIIHTAWASATCSFNDDGQVRRPECVGRVGENSHASFYISQSTNNVLPAFLRECSEVYV